jgi:hypothetical protein
MLRPVPHFSHGIAVGTKAFIENLFELNRAYFGGARKVGCRHVSGQKDADLFTFRDLGDVRGPRRKAPKAGD